DDRAADPAVGRGADVARDLTARVAMQIANRLSRILQASGKIGLRPPTRGKRSPRPGSGADRHTRVELIVISDIETLGSRVAMFRVSSVASVLRFCARSVVCSG